MALPAALLILTCLWLSFIALAVSAASDLAERLVALFCLAPLGGVFVLWLVGSVVA